MRPIRLTVASQTTSAPIVLDGYISPFNIGVAVIISLGGSLTYTVQHTFDDVFAKTYNPATGNWFDNATLATKTASADGNYAFPVTAIRLNVTVYTSGSATITAAQAGIV